MIHTRLTIYKSLKTLLNKLTKLAQNNPSAFKNIFYAVILNDMKEWAEYIPTNDSAYLVDLLERFIICHSEFQIQKFLDEEIELYTNVNTPQDNTTWRIIHSDKEIEATKKEGDRSWTPDPSCKIELIYWPGDPRDNSCVEPNFVPGPNAIDYFKMSTCEKMNIYVNRENNKYYYLDETGCWRELSTGSGSCSKDDIIELIRKYRGDVKVTPSSSDITFELSEDENINKKINLATEKDLEGIL